MWNYKSCIIAWNSHYAQKAFTLSLENESTNFPFSVYSQNSIVNVMHARDEEDENNTIAVFCFITFISPFFICFFLKKTPQYTRMEREKKVKNIT